jgi:RimJ/RimL family protein N-acetyltransferase
LLPTLTSQRLILRPFQLADAARVQQLAGEKIIADMTANVPHPYLDGMAEDWISKHPGWFDRREAVALAITLADSGELVGTIGITQIQQNRGNLAYWVGVPYWGQGICSAAAALMIDYGFAELKLAQLYAQHLPHNPASGKVMLKNGFTYQADVVVGPDTLKYYELNANEWQAVTLDKQEKNDGNS